MACGHASIANKNLCGPVCAPVIGLNFIFMIIIVIIVLHLHVAKHDHASSQLLVRVFTIVVLWFCCDTAVDWMLT